MKKYFSTIKFFQNGETALHAAAMFGHLTVCKQLIAAGSDILQKNQEGLTALQVARQQKYSSIYDYLQDRLRLVRARAATAT